MRVLTIIGARPQFIKAAPLSKALRENNVEEFLLHTGQHYDPQMSDIFFEELNIRKPDLNLHIQGGSHGQQTGRMLESIEETLHAKKPDRVLVYGDTNSTLAGALAAAKLHIPVDHVEAGLRSFNKKMPEEINRILTDHVSSLLFTPTTTATNNLKKEGVSEEQIYEVGDVMFDAVKLFSPLANNNVLETIGLTTKPYYLATIHRAENTDNLNNLKAILQAFEVISEDVPIVLPLHPRTKEKLKNLNVEIKNIMIINPVGYLEMLTLTQNAVCVLTDSGGLQKEAYFAKTPCITLRDQTEWIELIESGWNHLLPVTEDLIETLKSRIKETEMTPQSSENLYGKGDASQHIAESILKNG